MKRFAEVYERFKKRINQTDSVIARKANMYNATLSRLKAETIRSNRTYLWSLALALELNMEEADELFASAGLYMQSQFYLTDIEKKQENIIKNCINQKRYDVMEINIKLYEAGYPLLGNKGIKAKEYDCESN